MRCLLQENTPLPERVGGVLKSFRGPLYRFLLLPSASRVVVLLFDFEFLLRLAEGGDEKLGSELGCLIKDMRYNKTFYVTVMYCMFLLKQQIFFSFIFGEFPSCFSKHFLFRALSSLFAFASAERSEERSDPNEANRIDLN